MHDEATDIFAVNFWYARIFQKKKEQKEFFSYRQLAILIGLIALSWLPVKIYTVTVNSTPFSTMKHHEGHKIFSI
jgi:preprotein translocase subunit Sec63